METVPINALLSFFKCNSLVRIAVKERGWIFSELSNHEYSVYRSCLGWWVELDYKYKPFHTIIYLIRIIYNFGAIIEG